MCRCWRALLLVVAATEPSSSRVAGISLKTGPTVSCCCWYTLITTEESFPHPRKKKCCKKDWIEQLKSRHLWASHSSINKHRWIDGWFAWQDESTLPSLNWLLVKGGGRSFCYYYTFKIIHQIFPAPFAKRALVTHGRCNPKYPVRISEIGAHSI